MTRITLLISSQIAIATMVAGCASTPAANTTPAYSADPDCRQLSAEIANAEKARRAALEKEKGAWKAVIPVAVAARYASGKSAADKAGKQLHKLHTEFARQGCAGHDG